MPHPQSKTAAQQRKAKLERTNWRATTITQLMWFSAIF
jgi:hypothetical protein